MLPTGTVTFLFTDIQGSVPLWEREPEKMAEALQIHNTALRQAIESNGGVVSKTVGDAFQAAFPTALQALKAAIDGQRGLQSAAWNELGPLKVRMGLHTGEAELDPCGDEYAVSPTKNRIGRIHSAAHGCQILLSQETADLVQRSLPEGVFLKDMGENRLKGMQWLEHLYQVCAPDLLIVPEANHRHWAALHRDPALASMPGQTPERTKELEYISGGNHPMPTINLLSQPSPAAPTLRFAASELQRCLNRMNGDPLARIVERPRYQPTEPGIWLGLFPDVGLNAQSAHPLDDEIHIAVEGANGLAGPYGLIAGSNPRSVLMAAYRYLWALGCRWLRPGPEGEFIPRADPDAMDIHLHEVPAYRHRAVCIEGAVSLENVLDMVDWLPKLGLSGYFMQFREGFTFFDRWYRHQNNPLKTPEPFTVEQARSFTRHMEEELQKRGLAYHAIGHGWTCEAFGIPCLGWDQEPGRLWPPEFLRIVAEVNGKRSVPWDIASIAALCYSDPLVQEKLADCVEEYAAAHPQIDLLHVWLDDGFNNKCECPNCRTHRPADDYIQILNAIDECLTRGGLPHKIVFLAYVDMLWPPETERLQNPDRFVFMFAPISRTYRQAMKASAPLSPLPPFERNHLQFPSDIPGLLSFLQSWQAVFQGDSFVYDYHLISSGLYQQDPGLMNLARLLSEDVQSLKNLGLNGMVSCQLQRVFFPTGLAMYAMARTLWDDSLDFDSLAEEYFTAAFGSHGMQVQAYLLKLAGLLDFGWLGSMEEAVPEDVSARCRSAMAVITRFLPLIQQHMWNQDICHTRSWQYLFLHAQVTRLLIHILLAKTKGQAKQVQRNWQTLKQLVCQHEDELQPVLDVWAFVSAYEKMLESAHETT
jgi:class 3 adenylate cyclase